MRGRRAQRARLRCPDRAASCAVLILLFGAAIACRPPPVDYEGKKCAPERACPAGLHCDPRDWTCRSTPAGCPSPPPAPATCTGTDLYLSPDGHDEEDGTDPARPRRSLAGLSLNAGDRVHLAASRYPDPLGVPLGLAGSPSCPITISGTGGTTELESLLLLDTINHLKVQDLAVSGGVHVRNGQSGGVSIARVEFRSTDSSARAPAHIQIDSCAGCLIEACEFWNTRTAVLISERTSGLTFRLNRVSGGDPDRLAAISIKGDASALVEHNELSGDWRVCVSVDGGKLERNVFFDLSTPGAVGVQGDGAAVTSNSFLRFGASGAAAAGAAVFRNNLVHGVAIGLAVATAYDAGFNLFDGVIEPYPQGSSLIASDIEGPAKLEPDFTPDASSPAVDAADPALPVPLGGGARADIGARERGAWRQKDGSYCTAAD